MRKITKLTIGIIILIIALMLLAFSYYLYQLSPVSDDKKVVEVVIPKGSTGNKIASMLKENDLIRNEMIFKIYLKVHHINNISFGTYELNKSMGIKKIVDVIGEGKAKNVDIKVLFKEGLNIRGIAKVIADNTNNTEDEVFTLLKDTTYIDSLINEYWFLTDQIKNKNIYYPLEGYLSPNTYQFVSKEVTVKDIFKKMLDQTNTILAPYKNDIESSDFTVHEFITLASVVQSEGTNTDDMANIADVFYKRLEAKWSLGSCVTACYATATEPCVSNKVDTDFVSPYNTYLPSMAGKLPVGPISNPGALAVEATLNPADNNYWYFLSDKDKKTYFSKTAGEQDAKKAQLIKEGKWYAN